MGALTYSIQKATNLRAREYSGGHSGEITLAGKSKQLKDSGGLLSLVLELLGAIAIRLLQRYFKSWRSTLIVKLQNPSGSCAALARKAVPKDRNTLLDRPDHRSEISPQNAESEKPYQKGVVALFKNYHERVDPRQMSPARRSSGVLHRLFFSVSGSGATGGIRTYLRWQRSRATEDN